jgi:uncharacterized protein with HEPN domain
MDLKIAKEFIHIEGWLDRADDIVERGESTYFADVLLQEAGDSIMMKLGEAAKRLSVMNVPAPAGIDWAIAVANRNFIIHQYDEVSRPLTWETLAVDLPQWRTQLSPLFVQAHTTLGDGAERK